MHTNEEPRRKLIGLILVITAELPEGQLHSDVRDDLSSCERSEPCPVKSWQRSDHASANRDNALECFADRLSIGPSGEVS